MNNTSCKLGKHCDFYFFLEKKTKMRENRETENVTRPRFGINISYHHDQAKHNGDFYVAHANIIMGIGMN